MARFALMCLILAAMSTQATSQEIPTKPADGVKVSFDGNSEEIKNLSSAYLSGDWARFYPMARDTAYKVQDACKAKSSETNSSATKPSEAKSSEKKCSFDLRKDYVQLVWSATLPGSDKPTLLSAVIHDTYEPNDKKQPVDKAQSMGEPYSRVLPGLKKPGGPADPQLLEVFIADNQDASLTSYYVSKPLPDPLLQQVPAVVDKFLGPLFGAMDAIAGSQGIQLAPPEGGPPSMLTAVVVEVDLPEPRAGVEVTMAATLPLHVKTEFSELDERLRNRGWAVTSELGNALTSSIEKLTKAGTDTTCQKGTSATCREALHLAITTGMSATIQNPKNAPQLPRLYGLEAALHSAVDEMKAQVISGKFTLDNSPETHLSFGLVTSFAPKIFGDDQRAKVDGNKVVASALPQTLQMAVLNWSLNGYQQKTSKRWDPAAFFRLFTGVVFSPDIGVSVGTTFMVLSNLGVNVGYAHLFITRPEDTLNVGTDLGEKNADGSFKYSSELRRDPLRTGNLGALFFGASYNFK
jgi:hypothetical protein